MPLERQPESPLRAIHRNAYFTCASYGSGEAYSHEAAVFLQYVFLKVVFLDKCEIALFAFKISLKMSTSASDPLF